MQTTPVIDHEARPLACFNHLYRELPRLFATGGTQAEVDALFGGLAPALQGALGVTPGAIVGLRLFAEPWGWAPEVDPVDVDRTDLALDAAAPCFTVGEWSGVLLVPDADGGGRRDAEPLRRDLLPRVSAGRAEFDRCRRTAARMRGIGRT